MQKENIQFAFVNNVFKSFVKFYDQIGLFDSYNSFCCSLQANAKTVLEEILENI